MSEFKRELKYLVLKFDDIYSGLTIDERKELNLLVSRIVSHRMMHGKGINNYVVVNKDELYAETVYKLIEFSQTHTEEELKRLLEKLEVEFW